MRSLPRQTAIALALLLSSCSGPIWPSFALEISLQGSSSTTSEVGEAVRDFLIPLGYKDMGKDGYDEIHGTLRSLNLEKGKDIVLTVSLDRADVVPIRLSFATEALRDEARSDFDALQAALLTKWPVIRRVP